MDVVIHDGRIAAIQTTGRHWDGAVLDGSGKFLIPGLWDMSVHLSWTTDSALPLLIANGVTDVRDLGGNLEQIDDWRTRINSGLLAGPRILRVGPMLNGKSFNQYQLVAGPPDEARAVVRTLKFLGTDGIELERRIPRDSYFAILDEARREKIPVGGLDPIAITPQEVSDAGQTTIDNVDSIFEFMLSDGIPEDKLPAAIDRFLSSGEADRLFAVFVKNQTAVTPALWEFEWSTDPSSVNDPRLRYVAKSLRDYMKIHPLAPDDAKALRAVYPKLLQVVGRMNRDHVTLLTGTDLAGPRLPGISLHEEMKTLALVGLTPLQVLQAATRDPAIVLHKTDDFGSVAIGKFADLVLLDADPLKDAANLDRIAAVVANGRVFTRSDLDLLIQFAQREADRN